MRNVNTLSTGPEDLFARDAMRLRHVREHGRTEPVAASGKHALAVGYGSAPSATPAAYSASMRCSCSALLIAPRSVFLSSGSPTRNVDKRVRSLSSTTSATDSCTSKREPAQHTWPWLKKMPLTMPSTAWSSAASSKMMLAALPPSSSVTFLPRAGDFALDRLADRGGAGERDLVDVRVRDDAAPVAAAAGDDVHDARVASPASSIDLGEQHAVSGVVSAGLRTQTFPVASAGASFHAAISSGKFHGMIWPATPTGRGIATRCRVLELVGPARVVEEVRGRERDVDVARLLDRLAAVERLEHRELAAAFEQLAGDAVHVLRCGPGAGARPMPARRRVPPVRRRRRRPVRRRRPRSSTSSVAGLIDGEVAAARGATHRPPMKSS